MGTSPEFNRLGDSAVRRREIFLQEGENWSRHLMRDTRLHVSVIADSFHQSGERYHDYVSVFDAQQLIHWPDMAILRVARAAGACAVGPCSAAMMYGDRGSSHWVFGHLVMGGGFPDLLQLAQAKKGLSGDISVVFIGGASLLNADLDEAYHKKQVATVTQQMHDAGLPIDSNRIKTYWNTTQSSYNNVFARIDKEGKPWVHIELVYTLSSIF